MCHMVMLLMYMSGKLPFNVSYFYLLTSLPSLLVLDDFRRGEGVGVPPCAIT